MTTTRVRRSRDATSTGDRVRAGDGPAARGRGLEVEHASSQRRLRMVLVFATVCIAAALAYLAVHSPLLDVDHLQVARRRTCRPTGARRGVGRRARRRVVRRRRRENRAPHPAAAVGFVRSRGAGREFPNTVRITVTEYVPTAYVRRADGTFVLIARTGECLQPLRSRRSVRLRCAACGATGNRAPALAARRRGRHPRSSPRPRAAGDGDRPHPRRGRPRPAARWGGPHRWARSSRRQRRGHARGARPDRGGNIRVHRRARTRRTRRRWLGSLIQARGWGYCLDVRTRLT